jgi:hypothetical protein
VGRCARDEWEYLPDLELDEREMGGLEEQGGRISCGQIRSCSLGEQLKQSNMAWLSPKQNGRMAGPAEEDNEEASVGRWF